MNRHTITHILTNLHKKNPPNLTRSRWYTDEEWISYTHSDTYKQAVIDKQQKEIEQIKKQKARKQKQEQERAAKKSRSNFTNRNSRSNFTRNNDKKKRSPGDRRQQKFKICKFVLQNLTCRYRTCNYAHSSKDLEPMDCRFDRNCSFKHTKCIYIHSTESKKEFIQRLMKHSS